MNKQKIIDNFINERKGIPPHGASLFEISGQKFTLGVFQQRAKELGWVNGYKWGVEYQTNGNKPDLPDDIKIFAFYDDKWDSGHEISSYNWAVDASYPVELFRITDERFKPVEQRPAEAGIVSKETQAEIALAAWWDFENNKPAYDGALPPVGDKCLILLDDAWAGCFVVGSDEDGCMVCKITVGSRVEFMRCSNENKFIPLDHETRAKELERKRFVDAVIAVIDTSHSYRKAAGDMFDAGFRMPDSKLP